VRVRLVAPVSSTGYSGNSVTRRRWEALLRTLGHEVDTALPSEAEPTHRRADLLVALHAGHSAEAVTASRRDHPERPIVVALTGTDLYRDLGTDPAVRRSMELADRLVVLQPQARAAVPAELADRVVVIRQSVPSPPPRPPRTDDDVAVVVLAHLREVKDPLLTARAVRRLPRDSRVRVRHFGAGLDHRLAAAAARESEANPRYRWEGEVPHATALEALADSDVLVLTSRSEGGANVVSEAIVHGVPVLSTRIDGSLGMLGHGYPGYFDVGDEAGLARLLHAVEHDENGLRTELQRRVERLKPDYHPERELRAWEELLDQLSVTRPASPRQPP
jgi:putative glycosyltransferase (TIGR04348 family)